MLTRWKKIARLWWLRSCFAPRPGPFQGREDWMADLIEWCAVRLENHTIEMCSEWSDK